jgi:hypothetical protein
MERFSVTVGQGNKYTIYLCVHERENETHILNYSGAEMSVKNV